MFFTGHLNHQTRCLFSLNPGSRNLHPDYRRTSRTIPIEIQTLVEVEIDQTTPTISPSQAFPNPKSPVVVADGVVWLYCKDTNLHRPLPHLSKSPDLRLVPGA